MLPCLLSLLFLHVVGGGRSQYRGATEGIVSIFLQLEYYDVFMNIASLSHMSRHPSSVSISVVSVAVLTDPTIALFLYDYMLVLFQEVDLIWKGKFGIASTLYLMTKYL